MLKIDALVENIEGYVEARIELAKLDLKTELSEILVKFIFSLLMAVFMISCLFCLNLGLANCLNHWFESTYLGYFILAIFYFLVFFVIFKLKDDEKLNAKLKEIISTSIIKQENADGNKSTDLTDPFEGAGDEKREASSEY